MVVPERDVEKVIKICRKYHTRAFDIGYAVQDPERKVKIPHKHLIGIGSRFLKD